MKQMKHWEWWKLVLKMVNDLYVWTNNQNIWKSWIQQEVNFRQCKNTL